jgi:hypothetical protein
MDAPIPEVSISVDKVCFFVLKAREFEAKDVVTVPDRASNATDDGMRSVLEDHRVLEQRAEDVVAADFCIEREYDIADERRGDAGLARMGLKGADCIHKDDV